MIRPSAVPREQDKNQRLRELLAAAKPKRSKYRAVRCEVDGIKFDSRKEARRYQELLLLEKVGAIRGLITQPFYVLRAPTGWQIDSGKFTGSREIGMYRADFEYFDIRTGERVTEDVKSPATRTSTYRWKKKHVEAQFGITILET